MELKMNRNTNKPIDTTNDRIVDAHDKVRDAWYLAGECGASADSPSSAVPAFDGTNDYLFHYMVCFDPSIGSWNAGINPNGGASIPFRWTSCVPIGTFPTRLAAQRICEEHVEARRDLLAMLRAEHCDRDDVD
jgi:hypothetical protein